MGYTLIKALDGAQGNRKLFYLDSPDDLPIIDPQNIIAAGSEARVLTTGDKWIVNSELMWTSVPKETGGGGGGIGEAPFDGQTYAREDGSWVEIDAHGVEDSLTSTDTTKALSAAQGKILNDRLSLTSGYVGTLQTDLQSLQIATGANHGDIVSVATNVMDLQTDMTDALSDISALQIASGANHSDIGQVAQDLADFETDVVNDYIDKATFVSQVGTALQDSSIPAYGTDISYDIASRTVTMNKNDSTTETFILPQSTNTQDGLMTAADRSALTEVLSDVESLKNGGVWRAEFGSYANLIAAYPGLDVSTTEWFVNDYVEIIADESPTTGIHTQGNPTIYRVEVDTTETVKTLVYQKDVASSSVQMATNTATGIVKGDDSNTAGKVFVETDGSMSLVGYDAHTQAISDNTQDIVSLQTANTAMGTRVTTAEGNITGLGTRMTATETAATTLGGRVTTAEADIVAAQNDISNNTGDIADHETRISTNESWIAAPHIASDTNSGTIKLSTTDWELGGDPDGHLVINGAEDYINDIDQRLLGSTGKIGEIFFWPGVTPPDDALYCNGAAISRATYNRLFAVIGTSFGVGDGSTTFNLPDMRGEFVRGYDPTALRDPQGATRGFGKHQNSTTIPQYRLTASGNLAVQGSTSIYMAEDDGGYSYTGRRSFGSGTYDGAAANMSNALLRIRPTNINLLPCIRYKSVLINNVYLPAPDYSKTDTSINLIPTATGTWVADRDGYLRIRVEANGTSYGGYTINGIVIFQMVAGVQHGNWTSLARVSVGDIVQLQAGNGFITSECYFIPYKGNIIAPNINSPHLWLANTEVDLGDGSFGYRATGTISVAANTAYDVILPLQLQFNQLSCGGWWQINSGSKLPVICNNNSNQISLIYCSFNNNEWRFQSSDISIRANAPYDIWIRYTK